MNRASNRKAKEAEMRTDLIDLLAIERSLRMLRDDLQESVTLSIYLRATRKTINKLLRKLKMRIPEIAEITRTEERFL
jgi:hypothetical protein